MDEQLKQTLKRSLEELAQMQDRFDHWLQELPEESAEFRTRTRELLDQLSGKLDESLQQGEKLSQEAQLQAHLGLMEAKERFEASRKVFDDITDDATERSGKLFEELGERAEEARREAKEFWQQRGPELTDEFKRSSEAMVDVAQSAADLMQEQFSKWSATLAGMADAANSKAPHKNSDDDKQSSD